MIINIIVATLLKFITIIIEIALFSFQINDSSLGHYIKQLLMITILTISVIIVLQNRLVWANERFYHNNQYCHHIHWSDGSNHVLNKEDDHIPMCDTHNKVWPMCDTHNKVWPCSGPYVGGCFLQLQDGFVGSSW